MQHPEFEEGRWTTSRPNPGTPALTPYRPGSAEQIVSGKSKPRYQHPASGAGVSRPAQEAR